MRTRVDLHKATERAWTVLRHDLHRRLDEATRGEAVWPFLIEVEAPERDEAPCAPYVQVMADAEGLRAEVSSDHYLHPRYWLDPAQADVLARAGWEAPDASCPNHWRQVTAGRTAETADAIVTALREVFGVVHPAFLVDALDVVADDEPAVS
ncbi:TY-Chap domain-containing protein [Nocardioides sp. R1-1]|uniref:TY-Chap domain-containing protein n=1 Tax=Nocardioides sp. R1-1 TaxID=3383502 RepID=UPI0038D1D4A1